MTAAENRRAAAEEIAVLLFNGLRGRPMFYEAMGPEKPKDGKPWMTLQEQAALREQFAQIVLAGFNALEKEHDRRATELLAANNREVERRREAERVRDKVRDDYAKIVQQLISDQSTLNALRAQVATKDAAITAAAETYERYADLHYAKGKEGRDKAEANIQEALKLRAALGESAT